MGIDRKGRETIAWGMKRWGWISVEGYGVVRLVFLRQLLRHSVVTPTHGNSDANFLKVTQLKAKRKYF